MSGVADKVKTIFSSEKVTLASVFSQFGQSGFGLVFLVLALPSALPVPAPGFAAPFGVAILILVRQLLTGKTEPHLPEQMMNRSFPKPGTRLQKWMLHFVKFFDQIVRTRLQFVFNNSLFKKLLYLTIMLCALMMCIPVPLTNTLPAIGVFIISIAMLKKDGLVAMLGVACSLLGIIVSITITGTFIYLIIQNGFSADLLTEAENITRKIFRL